MTHATSDTGSAPGRRRPARNTALAIVFALLALNAWAQVILALADRSSDPAPLMLAQALVGLAAAATAVGSWRVRRWAPAAALAYAVVGATMIASLDLMLDLPPGAHVGLLTGAAIIFLFGAWAAWYLRAPGVVRGPGGGAS